MGGEKETVALALPPVADIFVGTFGTLVEGVPLSPIFALIAFTRVAKDAPEVIANVKVVAVLPVVV
jgi:hypothetical protein